VLHEAGALVCVEGIETEEEALCATDSNADLLQGNFFAIPAPRPPAKNSCDDLFARLFADFREDTAEFRNRRRARLEPYIAALSDAVLALSAGADRTSAVRALLELDCTERCYLVAADGSQIGVSAESDRSAAARDKRLAPIRPATGTNWVTKPFFRRAIDAPGKIQITRPYLSVTGPRLCVTLSYALMLNGSYHVLCVDLDFAALAGEDLAFGLAKMMD
jgi:hypothetical protein